MNGREFFPRAANAQSAQNTNVYVLRRNKMKMKDRVVLQTLRTAIHVLDTAAKVFAGASDDLTKYKRQIQAKTGDK
tara:strand:+ start:388 stop:615 length:228 start_codon:yes stop_codon:yes gene_type:complete